MDVKARVAGTINAVNVNEGDVVKMRDVLLILEAMKMEQPVPCPKDGTVSAIKVAVGDKVKVGQVLAVVD